MSPQVVNGVVVGGNVAEHGVKDEPYESVDLLILADDSKKSLVRQDNASDADTTSLLRLEEKEEREEIQR